MEQYTQCEMNSSEKQYNIFSNVLCLRAKQEDGITDYYRV